jgi:hypothetical protein
VIVYRSPNDMRRRDPEDRTIPAVVVKAARVWATLSATEKIIEWRMRRDTQREDTPYSGSNASFATIEQFEWDETRRWAFGFLREQGITIESHSLWRDREVELADIISAGLKDGEGS